jgi:phosphatidylinositol glycan class B
MAGVIFHLLAAFFSVGYHQCDELFQVYEFAGYKLGINQPSEMPWEFTTQMRSGVEPMLVYAATRLFHLFSVNNPFQIALFLRIVQGLVALLAIIKLIELFEKEIVSERARLWLWAFSLLFWCLPYFHVRLSSENFGITLFIYGLAMALNPSYGRNPIYLLLAGFLFGMAFVCRFQIGFMVAGLFAWLLVIKRQTFTYYISLVLGVLLALALGILVDKWLYGQWTISWWNYLYQNFVENKASIYGREPLYYYITESLLQLVPPFSLIAIAALFGFWTKFRSHVLTWITLPFIVLHFFVAHKELRFLFPVLNFLPLIVLLYFQFILSNVSGKRGFLTAFLKGLKNQKFIKTVVAINTLLLCYFTFKPADETSQALLQIYNNVEGDRPVLFYQGTNPYNEQASLNYFRNPRISTVPIDSATVAPKAYDRAYFFSYVCGGPDTVTLLAGKFRRIYSSYPAWIRLFNFNGWADRVNCYTIFRKEQSP